MEKFKKTFSLRKKKTPDDLNLLKPQQWQEDERKVREGTCSFQVKYLGHLEVFESRGMQVCEEALKALRKTKVTKGQRAILYVSGDALRVTDEISKGLIVDQTIDKVSFCAPDRNHERGFAYICRDGTTRRWICHGFLAVKESGERLSHAVGCAFAICLEKKQKREKESVHITYNDDKTSFTRHGSFRPASLMERIQDPQSVIIAEPPPSNNAGDQSSSSSSNNVISSSGHLRSRSSVREPSSALGQIPESSNESFSVSSTNSKKPTTTTPSGNKSNNAAAKELDESHDSRSKRDNSNIHFEHENATMSGGGTGNNNGGAASSSVSSTQATHAIPRPHASTTVFDRQRSLRLFPKLNETTSPFKREFSLRLEELPSNLSRSHPACTETIPEDDSNNSMNDSFFTSQFAFSNAIPEQTALPVFAASSNSLQVTFPSSWDAATATAASPSFMMKSHNSGMTDPFSSAPVNSTALQQALFGGGGAGGTGGGFADLGAEFSASSHYATQHSGSSPVPPPPPAMPPPPAAFASAHAPTNPFPVITPFGLSQFSGGETAGNNSFNSPFTNATNNFSPRNPWCRDMENVSSASCIATAGPKDPFDVDWIEKEKFFSGFGNSNMLSSPPALLRSTSAVVSTNPFLNYS